MTAFPANPTNNQIFTDAQGIQWSFDTAANRWQVFDVSCAVVCDATVGLFVADNALLVSSDTDTVYLNCTNADVTLTAGDTSDAGLTALGFCALTGGGGGDTFATVATAAVGGTDSFGNPIAIGDEVITFASGQTLVISQAAGGGNVMYAHSLSGNISFTHGVLDQLRDFGTTVDPDGAFVPATGVYTAPSTGAYVVSYLAPQAISTTGAGISAVTITTALLVNGVLSQSIKSVTENNFSRIRPAATILTPVINAGDTIAVRFVVSFQTTAPSPNGFTLNWNPILATQTEYWLTIKPV